MHILVIYHKLPYPVCSGADKRVLELCTILADSGHKVSLLVGGLPDKSSLFMVRNFNAHVYFYWERSFVNYIRVAKRYFDDILAESRLPSIDNIITSVVGNTLNPQAKDFWKLYPPGMEHYTAQLVNKEKIDAVIVEYVWMYQAILTLPKSTIKVLDTHDIMHRRRDEVAKTGAVFPLEIDYQREQKIFRYFDALIAIQRDEEMVIRQMVPERPVFTIGMTTFSDIQQSKQPAHGGPSQETLCAQSHFTIFYIGGINEPNINGIDRFLMEGWPYLVSEVIPNGYDVRLIIAGNVCKAIDLGRYEHTDRIVPMGYVQDPGYLYNAADVVINPAWVGTGLKIKTVEALSLGKVLITTEKGIEGMHGSAKHACIIVETPSDMAKAIFDIILNKTNLAILEKNRNLYIRDFLNVNYHYQDFFAFLNNTKSVF